MASGSMHDPMNPGMPPTTPPTAPGEKRRKLVKRRVKVESKKIGCPQCAAPIEVKNYAMADQVTCSYCGAVVDLSGEENKVVRQLLIQNRPKAALDLGQRGRLKGTVYEIIGRIRLKGFEDGEAFYWDEYLLFNPQKGYAWLQEDEGRWTFFQKMRNKPTIDPRRAIKGMRFVASGQTYIVQELSNATVDWVEGEFTYHVQKGDRVGNLDARSPCGRFECSAEWTENELEWLNGTRINRLTICQAFGIEAPPEQPIYSGDDDSSSEYDSSGPGFLGFGVVGWAIMFALLSGMFAMMTYTAYDGDEVMSGNVPASRYLAGNPAYVSEPFVISAPTIVQVEYQAFVDNSWVFVETELLDEQKETVHVWGNNISYYHGYSGGESWTEGSRYASTVFKVRKSGTYYLSISGGEGGSGNYGTTPRKETITVTVKTGVVLARYFLGIMAFCGFVLFLIAWATGQFDED